MQPYIVSSGEATSWGHSKRAATLLHSQTSYFIQILLYISPRTSYRKR